MGGSAVDIVARLRLNAEQFSSEAGKATADIAEKMKAAAQKLPQSFNQAFAEVQALATKGLNLGDQVKSLSDGAIAAEAKAAQMRALAEATDRVATSGRADAEALRLEADAARVAALASEQDAEALRSRAAQLELIQQELAKATGATNAFGGASNNGTKSTGAQRAGLQQLSMQLNDAATMYAGGASAAQIFATQSGQVVQALQLIGGEGNAVLRFLGGWQGMLVTTVSVAMVPFIAKLFEAGDAEKAAAESTKKLRQETDQLYDSTQRAIYSQERLRREMIATARVNAARVRDDLATKVADAEAKLRRYNAAVALAQSGTPMAGDAIQSAAILQKQVQEAGKSVAEAHQLWDKLRGGIAGAEIEGMQAAAEASIDKTAAATRRFKAAVDELNDAYKANRDKAAYTEGYTKLKAAYDAETKAIKGEAKERRAAEAAAKKAQRELDSAYESTLKSLDPLRYATEQYLKSLKEIDKLSSGKNPRVSAPEAADLKTAAATRYIDQLDPAAEKDRDRRFEQVRKAQDEGRRLFDASVDDAVDRWVKQTREGLAQSAEDAGRLLGRAVGDELATVVGNVADLFGVRISGPLSLLMRRGGISEGANSTSTAILKALDDLGYTLPQKTKDGVRDGVKTLFEGTAYGQLGGSVFASLTGGKENKLASSIGGVLGDVAGKAVGKAIGQGATGLLKTIGGAAGPLGSILGGVLGGLVGGLFNKPKWSDAQLVLNPYGQVQGTAGTGKGSAEIAAATNSANSVASAVNSIVQQLGATVQGLAPMTLGTWDGKYRVALGNTTEGLNAKSTLGRAGLIQDFGGDQEAAIKYAVSYQLSHAVITGLSEASKRILASGQDINSALTKVLAVESIPKDLKAMLDPVGAAIDELNRKWKQTVAALDEGGASAEQRAQAERLYNLQLEQVKNTTTSATQTLKDFRTSLGLGSNSPLSLRDQEAAAKTQLQPFLDAISSGKSIDQGKYQAAAQSFLDVERQLYGSGGQYFDAFEMVRTATNAAISAIDNVAPISPAVESPFAKSTASNTEATAEILAEMRDQNAALIEQNRQLLAALRERAGGFVGEQRGFA